MAREHLTHFTDQIQSAELTNPFAALETLCQSVLGHRLFSCSVFDLDQSVAVAARVYSNNAKSYPVSGLKDIVPNRWTNIVIDQGNLFVANTVEEFSDVFPDYEKIAELGLGSVINIPVIIGGKFKGTVNALHEANYYTAELCDRAKELTLPAMLAFSIASEHTDESSAKKYTGRSH